MSYNANIPTHDEDLYINENTTLEQVDAFVEARLKAPAVLNDVVVFNFSSYAIDGSALVNAANELDAGTYIIPYQVPGVWGYIVGALPEEVANATLLTYRQQQGEYHAYPNWRGAEGSATDRFEAIYESMSLGEK